MKETRTVTIVGVGALGSIVASLLRNEDFALNIIDFDRVESKNIKSQFHSKPNIGKNKTESLKSTLNFLFGLKVNAFPTKLTKDNVDTLLKSSYLVIDCLDNGASRKLVQDYIRTNNIICLHGGLAADGAFGKVAFDKDFIIDNEDVAGQPTCEGDQHLPFISIVASFMAKSAQEFLRFDKQTGYSISPRGVLSF